MGSFRGRRNHASKQTRMAVRFGILVVGLVALSGFTYVTGWWNDNSAHDIIESTGEFTTVESDWQRLLAEVDDNDLDDVAADIERDCKTDEDKAICRGFGQDACKKLQSGDEWMLIFVILGLLYLFVGIAIVCDELFVPALEIVAEDLNLSADVAGATLMAAGGSAPELATSFVGTFKRSDVGFGTIVGSAVFNVLFVIGMCVIFTPEKYAPLELTWWPLFRDCSYYVMTLAFLAGFMYDGEIEIWEAAVQFLLYFGYVYMMSYSEQLEVWFTEKFAKPAVSPTDGQMLTDLEKADEAVITSSAKDDTPSASSPAASFNKPSTFRVGILQLLTSKNDLTTTAGVAFVSKIKGDVNEVFDRIDSNKNGEIDKSELKSCLLELGTPEEELADDKVDEVMRSIDKNNNGFASKADFTLWYLGNEQRLKNKTREIFDKYDTDKKNTIHRDDVLAFMVDLGHNTADVKTAIEEAISAIPNSAGTPDGFLTYDDFTAWYFDSLFWEKEKATAEAAVETTESMFEGLCGGMMDLVDPEVSYMTKVNFVLTMPLTALLCLVVDCRPPGMEKYAALTMFGSIVMIALFAIVMVELAEIFGKTVGIPDVVMGLTILAAGTSVPDLLSSVIVAQQGQGDMAVSSSIGSNIFDVAFGLPLPWLCFNIMAAAEGCACNVMVSGKPEQLFISLLILLGMVAAIVVAINHFDWKMTFPLGVTMFVMYFCYLALALSPAITPPKQYQPKDCAPFSMGY